MEREATPDPGEVRIVAFDLDGTLLRGDTACEVLARPIGRLARMREMEASSSTEQLAAARTEMAGWYQDYSRSELLGFLDQAELAPGAEDGCRQLREAGVEIVITSVTWPTIAVTASPASSVSVFVENAVSSLCWSHAEGRRYTCVHE